LSGAQVSAQGTLKRTKPLHIRFHLCIPHSFSVCQLLSTLYTFPSESWSIATAGE
jgi:hypothetical protein